MTKVIQVSEDLTPTTHPFRSVFLSLPLLASQSRLLFKLNYYLDLTTTLFYLLYESFRKAVDQLRPRHSNYFRHTRRLRNDQVEI
jgi:hypothetical protein